MAAVRTTVSDLSLAEGELSFRVSGPLGERDIRFWGDFPDAPEPSADAALAAILAPAMTVGGELSLPLPLSTQVRRSLPDIQSVLRTLASGCASNGRELQTVDVIAPDASDGGDPGGHTSKGVAVFFSGGVDSWFALLSNPEVTDLIYVHGFDIPIDQPEVSADVERCLLEVANAQGRRLHIVRTDLRQLTDPCLTWEIESAPALAVVALLFKPVFRRVLIGASNTYTDMMPRGPHPLHDHLWSTEGLQIEHRGAHMARPEKVRQVAMSDEALDVLRVCWRRVDEYNCGCCEKCLRTMVALEVVGALERCSTFTEELDLNRVAELRFPDPDEAVWWEENLRFAIEHGAPARLVGAIEECLSANPPPPKGQHELHERLSEAEARSAALEGQLETVLNSRSWRATSLPRRAGAAVRAFRRR